MNMLGYRCTDDNGLSFELIVDGQPLGNLVGAQDNAIPFWIIEDDLPYWPPNGDSRVSDIRIVCVCACGEYGCGHTHCRVIRDGDNVIFRSFELDTSEEGRKKEFCFRAANYGTVVNEIVQQAHTKRTEELERQKRLREGR